MRAMHNSADVSASVIDGFIRVGFLNGVLSEVESKRFQQWVVEVIDAETIHVRQWRRKDGRSYAGLGRMGGGYTVDHRGFSFAREHIANGNLIAEHGMTDASSWRWIEPKTDLAPWTLEVKLMPEALRTTYVRRAIAA